MKNKTNKENYMAIDFSIHCEALEELSCNLTIENAESLGNFIRDGLISDMSCENPFTDEVYPDFQETVKAFCYTLEKTITKRG
jgi:hypothetical protein